MITFLFNAKEKYQEYKTKIDNCFKENKEKIVPLFRKDKIDRSRNDFQMYGYYDKEKKAFIETIFSPKNLEKNIICQPSFIYIWHQK